MESRSPKDYLLKPEEHSVFWLTVLAALLAMQIGSGWLPGPGRELLSLHRQEPRHGTRVQPVLG